MQNINIRFFLIFEGDYFGNEGRSFKERRLQEKINEILTVESGTTHLPSWNVMEVVQSNVLQNESGN